MSYLTNWNFAETPFHLTVSNKSIEFINGEFISVFFFFFVRVWAEKGRNGNKVQKEEAEEEREEKVEVKRKEVNKWTWQKKINE